MDWEWKNFGFGFEKKEYFILIYLGLNNLLVVFAMSNEFWLRLLIRSSKEVEIKIKGKGYIRYVCFWGKVKNKLIFFRGDLVVYF